MKGKGANAEAKSEFDFMLVACANAKSPWIPGFLDS